MIDRRKGIAGLAHVVLPASEGNGAVSAYKFADVAVPELINRVVALGARISHDVGRSSRTSPCAYFALADL